VLNSFFIFNQGRVMARTVEFEVSLSSKEREYLKKNSSSGKWGPRAVKRALILLKADTAKGASMHEEQIAKEVDCSISTVRNIKLKFAKGGGLQVIGDKHRSGRPRTIDGEVEAYIIAVACSNPPEGRTRWTLQLISDRVVALTEVESCSHMSVARTLKKTNLSLAKKGVENSQRIQRRICVENGGRFRYLQKAI
jgi:transposase